MKGIPRNTASAKHRDLRRNLAAPVSKKSKKVYLIFVDFVIVIENSSKK